MSIISVMSSTKDTLFTEPIISKERVVAVDNCEDGKLVMREWGGILSYVICIGQDGKCAIAHNANDIELFYNKSEYPTFQVTGTPVIKTGH